MVAAASFEGAFTRFEAASVAIFAAMVSLYAVATYFLDAGLRAFTRSLAPRVGAVTALAFALAWVLAFTAQSVPMAVFLAPVAAASAVAAIEAALRRSNPPREATSTAAKSPGARPAST
jgi:hypothetical protein